MPAAANSPATQPYDVIIAGGGPVGLTMAVTLTGFMHGLRVAIIDRRPFEVPADARASALGAGVTRIFETMGLWDEIAAHAEPVTSMKITDSGRSDISRPVFLSFEGDVAPGRPYAHMVPNRDLIAALLARIDGKVDMISPASVTALTHGTSSATLELDNGRTLHTTLVIAADGGRSALRDMAGIGTISHDYRQAGLVTTIAHEYPHEGTAFEHFRPAGPFASLPLPGNRSSLVWTETSGEAARIKALSADAQAQLIAAEMGLSLGPVTLEEPVQSFPLGLRIARTFIGERLALIGDAAHVIHPIAGQGLNLGLKDAAALTETIIDALRLGEDAGSAAVLARYQQWRRFDTALMAMATDSLNRLFSNDVSAVRALRDLGLGIVDRIEPVKSVLIRHAAGIGDGPKLLRGQAI